jgi:AcrR family transcriptional regulator
VPGQQDSGPGQRSADSRRASRPQDPPGAAGGPSGRTVRLTDSGDELWPPFSVPASDREAQAHRKICEHSEQPLPRGRGRNRNGPPLTRTEIVDAAIAMADAEGAEAVSMRKIAQVLQAGTMSLYWHVANKEQLLDLMLDALAAEDHVPEPSGDWRADLQALARARRATLHRHLWAMEFLGGRPPLGPNTLLNMENSLALLDSMGLDAARSLRILETVLTYVLGAVLREMREMRADRDQAQADITMEEWEPLRDAWRDRLAADGRFTRVVSFLDEHIDPDSPQTRDERFEFGLTCLIDGIAASLGAPGGSRTRNGPF